jgi:hypothetical protein
VEASGEEAEKYIEGYGRIVRMSNERLKHCLGELGHKPEDFTTELLVRDVDNGGELLKLLQPGELTQDMLFISMKFEPTGNHLVPSAV